LNKNKTILIIDGTNLIHRNYYVHSYRKTKSGIATGGLYGTIRSLKSYINRFDPSQIYIAFDKSEHTFRKEVYPKYKANRKDIDSDLLSQFALLEKYCDLTNIPFIQLDMYEADDIIASLSLHAKQYGLNPYVISGDKDLLQLMNKDVKIVYLSNSGPITYSKEMFIEEYQIYPEQFIDYKALVGDPVDNISGIPGIGMKIAANLLTKFKNLDGIYKNIDRIKGKRQENLLKYRDKVYLFKELLTLKPNLDLDYKKYFIEDVKAGFNLKNRDVQKFLQELELKI